MIKDHILSFLLVTGAVSAAAFGRFMLEFIFLYPLFMSCLWITGALYYYYQWERKSDSPDDLPELKSHPFVSILVPCYNEERQLEESIAALAAQNYPSFEIIAINDASTDRTGKMLDKLMKTYPMLRVIHHESNQGKAMGLRSGAMVAKGQHLVCIDCDAVMHPNAVAYMVYHLNINPRVGAVTGNPRVRSRGNLLAKIQIGEYSSIIGMIKRAQRVYGRIFTVSGVICAFRRRALEDVGYWSPDMITEDIDVSWALQRAHWSIQYVPNAIGWIWVPETFRGLWRQRLRWARGGAEAFLKYFFKSFSWRQRRMWPVFFEYLLSVFWAFIFIFAIILYFLGKFFTMPTGLYVATIFPPAFWGLVLGTMCLWQMLTSLVIESRYEPKLGRALLTTIWYPIFYWAIIMATIIIGFPMALFTLHRSRAIWTSPDRGKNRGTPSTI